MKWFLPPFCIFSEQWDVSPNARAVSILKVAGLKECICGLLGRGLRLSSIYIFWRLEVCTKLDQHEGGRQRCNRCH